MEVDDKIKKDILERAERTLHYTNLLIAQCDSWLSAEEGNRNMEQRILERMRKEKEEKSSNNNNLETFKNRTK